VNDQARALLRNRWLQAILLIAFLARAMIPAGFMPGPGGLMICSGYAPITSAANAQTMHDDMPGMDMPGMHMAQHSGHEGSSLCPFAAAATTMASGHGAVNTVSTLVESVAVQLPEPPLVPRGTIVPTRLPRGPPGLA